MAQTKMAIVSDGVNTCLFLNGVFYGSGIERLEFSTEDRNGNQCATIRMLEIDAARFNPTKDPEFFSGLFDLTKE